MNIRSEDQLSGLAISLMAVASALTVANVGSVAKIGGSQR